MNKRVLGIWIAAVLSWPPVIAQIKTVSVETALQEHSMAYFPAVRGRNIDNQAFTLPQDFEGEYNLVLLVFTQEQQALVNTWLMSLRSLEADFPNLQVYELPTLPQFNWFQRRMLDYWMSSGISDPQARATTITLYTDVDAIQNALVIPDTSTIRLVLVDRAGSVYWQGQGAYSAEQFQDLSQVVLSLAVQPAS